MNKNGYFYVLLCCINGITSSKDSTHYESHTIFVIYIIAHIRHTRVQDAPPIYDKKQKNQLIHVYDAHESATKAKFPRLPALITTIWPTLATV